MTDKKTPITPPPQPPAVMPSKGNGLAIASLILGIISFSGFFLLTGIPAIITGIIALKQNQTERAMSIAGIILGGLATLLSLLFILFAIFLIVIGTSMDRAPQTDDYHFDDRSMPVDSTRT
jgi:membrane-bound ClpP family serine protease